ncbi:hypothetical protein, partial [Klebsiella pneumoniae]|uniref:hypothetical protein n=1 Tax=Klebsiella pneumoniae TaxID=573 RepID=UPI003D0420E3
FDKFDIFVEIGRLGVYHAHLVKRTQTTEVHQMNDASQADRHHEATSNGASCAGDRGTEFDFIVCGAGSSGSVVAARLAEDGQARVL